MKITVQRESTGEEISLTISEGANLETWEEIMRIILRWVSFTEGSNDEVFSKED